MKSHSFFTSKLFLLFILSFAFFTQQPAQKKELTFEQVFKFSPPRLTQRVSSISQWYDSEHYLLEKKPEGSETVSLLKINAATGEESILIDYNFWQEQLPEGFQLSGAIDKTSDYNVFLFTKENDLYSLNIKNEVFKRLTNDGGEKKNPALSPNGKFTAYTYENNLYAVDIENEKVTQHTFDGSDLVYNGYQSWIYYEEIFGRKSKYKAFWFSPDDSKLAFIRFDDHPVPEFILVRADGVHGEVERTRYPKPGDSNPDVKLGIIDLSDNSLNWIDDNSAEDKYIAFPIFTPDNKKLTYQVINRGQDKLEIISYSLADGLKSIIYKETQPSWVEFHEDVYFMKNGDGFLITTDFSGWKHIYHFGFDGKLKKQITSGEFTVFSIDYVDEENGKLFFSADKDESTEKQLFSINMNGKNFHKITSKSGSHSCSVSTEGKYILDRHSSITQPTVHSVLNSDGKIIREIANSRSAEMDNYELGKTELFRIETEDGYKLPAKWILPADFDETKKYPVVLSVYGGPDSRNVSNSFPFWLSGYFLAQNDIIYLEFDNRGSGHFGKKVTSQMHRNLGKWEIEDLKYVVRWLRSKQFINADKIGIEGGSYGGYYTCMALTAASDYVQYGVAEYSVTDWLLYDNVYTERYMDTPEENPEGYKAGSALTYADNYKGGLLITHGTMDDNVHMQNTIQLVDKLTDLDKDFELMLYPNSRHGVGFPKFFHASREKVQFWFRNLLGRDF
ncbi:MAG: S9 family peptidase [Bacteroidetes bacterium]|nr:S9 family peptidase [Bacteroidota bacterium]MBU1680681.1 S9 family peptidase [Bacteroidota bacterium]MBU2505850.1 S9 family peptidase [Bacteroidota bacterium]